VGQKHRTVVPGRGGWMGGTAVCVAIATLSLPQPPTVAWVCDADAAATITFATTALHP
jgi:hypothetical protein